MKKKKKIILITILSILLLLIIIPIIVTRSFFIKAFILPEIEKTIGISINCESISLNPFSSVEIKDLVLGEKDSPIMRAENFQCRFSLFSILGGTVKINELSIRDVNIKLVQKQNGELNLPLMNKKKGKGKKHSETKNGGKSPLVLDLNNVSFENLNAHIMQEGNTPDQTKEIILNNASLDIPSFKNDGKEYKIGFNGEFSKIYINNMKIDHAYLNIDTKLALDTKFIPQFIEIESVLNKLKGSANNINLNGHEMQASLQTDMSDDGGINVKSLKVTETHNGEIALSMNLKGILNLNPLTAQADLSIAPFSPKACNLIGAIIGDFDFGKTNATYNSSFSLDAKQNLNAKGKLLVKDFTMFSEKLKLAKLKPMKFSILHNISGNLKDKMIRVNTFNVDLSNNQQKFLDLGVSEPFSLSMGDKVIPIGKAPKIMLNCYKFPLNMINAIAKTEIKSGYLNAKIVTDLGNLGKAIDINGNMDINNLTLKLKGLSLKSTNIRQTLNAHLTDFNKLKISQAGTQISAADEKVMEMQLNGDMDIKNLNGNIVAQIYDVNENIFALFPENMFKNIPEKFNLKARIKTILQGKKDLNTNCDFEVDNLIPADKSNRRDLPLKMNGKMDANIKNNIVSIKSFLLKLNSQIKQIALLKGSTIYHLNPEEGVSTFDVEASGINLKYLQKLLLEKEKKNSMHSTDTITEKGTETTQQEPGPIDLKGMQLQGKIVLKDILYENARISYGDAIIKISDNKMYIKPFKMVVNDSKMNGEGFVDLGIKGFKYDISTDVKELPVDTFVSIFEPDLQGTISGGIKTFDFTLKGKGVSKENLKNNLTANGAFSLNNIKIENLPFQNILTDSFQSGLIKNISSLALQSKNETNRILKFLDLKKMGFDDGIFRFTLLKGVIKSDTFNLVGKDHYISGNGGINIFDKSLKNVRFDLGISEKMAEKIGLKKKYLDAFNKKNEYYFLPSALGFSGKYPDIKFEYKDAVSGVITGIVKNIGIRKLKEKVPIAGEILDKILNSKKKENEDDSGKKAKDKINSILNDLLK